MKKSLVALCACWFAFALQPQGVSADAAPLLQATFEQPIPGEGGGSKGNYYSIVNGQGRNGGKCLQYHKDAAKVSASGKKENFHYDFIVKVQPQTTYYVSAWFRAEGDLRPSVRLATKDWQTLASGICAPSKDWQEVRVVFSSGTHDEVRVQLFGGGKTEARETLPGTSFCDDVTLRQASATDQLALRQCQVNVDAHSVLHQISPLFFGVNTLFWIEDDASLKDGKVARLLRDMPCHLMRFPGGEVADNYHWKAKKLDNLKQFPFSEGPDKLDCDKFMVLCRQVGAEPIFVVNLESGWVHNNMAEAVKEAADWVRYANQEKGYQVKYWEIGNETYLPGTYFASTAREYADAFAQFSRAMKAVDPTIKIGAVGPMEPSAVVPVDRLSKEELARERELARSSRKDEVKKKAGSKADAAGDAWWPTLLKVAGAQIDFAIVHRYYPTVFGPAANAGRPLVELRDYFQRELPGRHLPFALTEWNAGRDTASGGNSALIVAELIQDYVEAGVEMACLWPMRYPGSTGKRTLLDIASNEPKPSYTVMKLYSSHMAQGSKLVKVGASNKSVLACASLAADGKHLAVFLLNKSSAKEKLETLITVPGFPEAKAKAVSLVVPDVKGDQGTLSETPVTAKSGALSLALPPLSLTVVTYE